ncbi:MAG: malonyl CoA-acyl carrier protein transacylase [Polaromonas sp. 24-62-144]|nr:MAG: malonyl CoA-acyl carrier protein transacylase [Polaromonas sp. 24-62-144]
MKPFAFVFPGQGSQSVGMLDAWNDHPVVRETLAEASDALGQDLGALIREGTKETLALTTHTQPVMLVAGIAAFRVWMAETGTLPAVVAGHSLGEYSALVAAGVLSLASAAPLVRFRAQAMQDAVPVGTGAMAAIMGMPADQVIDGCAEALRTFGGDTLEVVEAVNFNDPLQTFSVPQIPVINNIDVTVETSADRIRAALYRQAFGPVRWVECVQAIKSRGVTTLVEAGPGRVLAGLVKRIDPELTGLPLFDPATLADVQKAVV